jgi:hypothetical protein
MAYPVRNPNEHQRAVAAKMVADFKGRRAPGMPPPPPPLPKVLVRRTPLKRQPASQASPRPPAASAGGVNKAIGASPAGGGVNKATPAGGVNAKPKRSGDRHRNKGDRHKPGYMRDYMRRKRTKKPR